MKLLKAVSKSYGLPIEGFDQNVCVNLVPGVRVTEAMGALYLHNLNGSVNATTIRQLLSSFTLPCVRNVLAYNEAAKQRGEFIYLSILRQHVVVMADGEILTVLCAGNGRIILERRLEILQKRMSERFTQPIHFCKAGAFIETHFILGSDFVKHDESDAGYFLIKKAHHDSV